jgi:hypothetical protein
MSGESLRIELPSEMVDRLRRAADRVGIIDLRDAVTAAVAEWCNRYGGEESDSATDEKYFVNQALDDLIARRLTKT